MLEGRPEHGKDKKFQSNFNCVEMFLNILLLKDDEIDDCFDLKTNTECIQFLCCLNQHYKRRGGITTIYLATIWILVI